MVWLSDIYNLIVSQNNWERNAYKKIYDQLATLTKQVGDLMATIQEIQALADSLNTKLDTLATDVKAALAAIPAAPASQADLDVLAGKLQTALDKVTAEDTSVKPPTP